MAFAYILERSWRSIHILCVNPEHLRIRLPEAWDNGQSLIAIDEVPESCARARKGLEFLGAGLSRDNSSFIAREFGFARASVRRLHGTTLAKWASVMVDVHSDLEGYAETMKHEARNV